MMVAVMMSVVLVQVAVLMVWMVVMLVLVVSMMRRRRRMMMMMLVIVRVAIMLMAGAGMRGRKLRVRLAPCWRRRRVVVVGVAGAVVGVAVRMVPMGWRRWRRRRVVMVAMVLERVRVGAVGNRPTATRAAPTRPEGCRQLRRRLFEPIVDALAG